MAALTDNVSPHPKFKDVRGTLDGTRAMPSYGTGDHFFRHALIGILNGLVGPLGAQAGDAFVGICQQERQTTDTKNEPVSVNPNGQVWERLPVAGATATADHGRHVFSATDNPADATLTPPTDGSAINRAVGTVYEYRATNVADTLLYKPEETKRLEVVNLANSAHGDFNDFDETVVMSRPFRLLQVGHTVTTTTTGSGSVATFTPTVAGAAVTGTHNIATGQDAGDQFAGNITGAAAVGAAGDVVRVTGSTGTAFDAGGASVWILVEYYD